MIRNCRELFHQDLQSDDELAASTALIDAPLAKGKFADAASELEKGRLMASKSANEIGKLQVDLVLVRAEIFASYFASATAQLRSALQSSHAHHLMGIELESRLAMGILKSRSGQLTSA